MTEFVQSKGQQYALNQNSFSKVWASIHLKYWRWDNKFKTHSNDSKCLERVCSLTNGSA